MTRIHITSNKHWSISEVQCPECHATKGHGCIKQMRDARLKLNFERFPSTTVHAARVREAGHLVLGNAPVPIHHDKIPANALLEV